ncbi:conserved hypothetical protein [Listeria seeligeri FSL N1-067]|uniref:Uncharacterized protein n=1 Tax=Listeria seeligeri FSL N1-067 TaxID=702453 RepID=E3ZP14_LISSE|nr:conserved hypothetical protein [Listeria seeligeri FSL N1-067]
MGSKFIYRFLLISQKHDGIVYTNKIERRGNFYGKLSHRKASQKIIPFQEIYESC